MYVFRLLKKWLIIQAEYKNLLFCFVGKLNPISMCLIHPQCPTFLKEYTSLQQVSLLTFAKEIERYVRREILLGKI